MIEAWKAEVIEDARGQHILIPKELRFSTPEVYVQRTSRSGVLTLSEKEPRPSMAEIFKMFDEAGGADFELERDLSPPREVDLG